MSRWVVNTSPLVFLAHLDRLDLLWRGADEILLPPAVLREVHAWDDEATSKIDAARRTWLQVGPPPDQGALDLLRLDLDDGEAEVVALGRELAADVWRTRR